MKRLFMFCVVALWALLALPAAAQPLAASLWYAVVYDPSSETLHWITPAGEQASLPRPTLPNEAPGAALRIDISPNGRYAIIAATLNNNNEGLGIYDFAAGAFTATHEAAPGEQIVLGVYEWAHRFNAASTRAAVSFFSGNLQTPITWRLITFDLATGAALAQVTSAEAGLSTPAGTFPRVVYYDLDEAFGADVVHFEMSALTGDDGSVNTAFGWYAEGALPGMTSAFIDSGYGIDGDIHLVSGESIFTYMDDNYGAMIYDGLQSNHNAVGRGILSADSFAPTTIWVDGTRYNSQARWATSGQWVLYFSDDGASSRHWNVIQANGTPTDNSRTPLGTNIIDAHGVTDGFIVLTDDNRIQHAIQFPTEAFLNEVGVTIFQSAGADPLQIIYTPPLGATFTLNALGITPDDIAQPPQPPPPPQNPGDVTLGACPGAPVQRLQVGGTARVAFTDGAPLRVRQSPGGEIVTTLAEGTAMTIIGGPVCQGNFSWWQLQAGSVNGWSAEGDLEGYYIEPLGGGVGQTPNDIAQPPQQPPQNPGDIAAPVTATPTLDLEIVGVVLGDGDCSSAPPQRLTLNGGFRTNTPDGTLALRNAPTDEFPFMQVGHNVSGTIIAGPVCHGGYRVWRVSFVQNGGTVTGWLNEGTPGRYFLDPL